MNSIDLHTHSHFSDGELSPTDLVATASQQGVTVMALTDHDTIAGLDEAYLAAKHHAMQLIAGVEITARWTNRDIHVVGVNFNPNHPALIQFLDAQAQRRATRAQAIIEKLQQLGCDNVAQKIQQMGALDAITRAHFAKYLVEQGFAKDFKSAFKKYLATGKPAFVATDWPSMTAVIDIIQQAGGQAILAHPGRYELSRTKLRLLIEQFKAAGGDAMEVITSNHTTDQVLSMAKLAEEFHLLASSGSDFHGPSLVHARLGRLPTLPKCCRAIWANWSLTDSSKDEAQL